MFAHLPNFPPKPSEIVELHETQRNSSRPADPKLHLELGSAAESPEPRSSSPPPLFAAERPDAEGWHLTRQEARVEQVVRVLHELEMALENARRRSQDSMDSSVTT